MPPRTAVKEFGQQGFSLKAELEKFWGAKKDSPPATAANSAAPAAGSGPASEAGSPAGRCQPDDDQAKRAHNRGPAPDSEAGATAGKRPLDGAKAKGTEKRGKKRRSRSSSSSSRPVAPLPKRKKPESTLSGFREPRKSKWDAPPHLSDLLSQQRVMGSLMPKKKREVYCGNLTAGLVTLEVLREALTKMFCALPTFGLHYPDLIEPIKSVAFPHDRHGMFAFVEFFDEVLASTAVQMSGFELCGRSVKVGRPQGYIAGPGPELPPLDVSPLRRNGLLPAKPDFVVPSVRNTVSSKLREIYIGNLLVGKVTQEIITEFLTPVCMALPEYIAEHGPPVCRVSMSSNGSYCFVQFQTEEMAARVIPIFDNTEFFGRKIKVGRPANCPNSQELAQQAQMPIPPPPMAPLADSEIEAAAGAAVRQLGFV